MKNRTLLQTNLLICVIIIVGFLITSVISYRSNIGIFQKDIEMVSSLSSEGLYNEISTIFSQPVNVSLTMANDSLLKDFLTDEKQNKSHEVWQKKMRAYLDAYRLKYGYDSVFLVSVATGNYYHFEGLDRVLTPDNPENVWYYNFLEQDEEYSLNVDNDEAVKDNTVTVFVNCRIKDVDGSTLGVVGVGMRVNSLQSLLSSYEEKYGVQAYLVDDHGVIEASSSITGYENTNLFDTASYSDSKNAILQNRDTQEKFWYSSDSGEGYVVTRYEPNLKWHLVVENDASEANQLLGMQLFRNVIIIALIVLMVLIIITSVIRRYNVRISELTVSQELEYQRLLHESTEGLYENIFELDMTHNCAGGESTRKYFESLGLSPDAPYDKALHVVAGKQIKSEYIQNYLDIFSPLSVLNAYKEGITNLSYDFMTTEDGINYHWIRMSARIFYWSSDNSVRMITYRMNIDAEKKRELTLLENVQKDSMTGLYNKRTTEELIASTLETALEGKTQSHGFLIFDIDNFKIVNDTMEHSFGDYVINEIAAEIKTQFRENDIVGRIGGDEFAVLMKNVDNGEGLKQKLARLCARIENKDFGAEEGLVISCSIGIALFPEHGTSYSELYEKADHALYYAKSHGKNFFVIYGEHEDDYSFRSNQRDMEMLMNFNSDGLAQYACTEPLKLIYFNQKCVELFEIPADVLSSPDFDPMEQIHPDDVERVHMALSTAALERRPFTNTFRVRQLNGRYVSVRLRGIFITELYQNQYPIFYVMYTREESKSDQ